MGISSTLSIIHQLEGRKCALCGFRKTQVHHIIAKSKANGKARKIVESKPELLAKLCQRCHQGEEGVHALRETRQKLFEHKVKVYGLNRMLGALAGVSACLRIPITWESLGYELPLDK